MLSAIRIHYAIALGHRCDHDPNFIEKEAGPERFSLGPHSEDIWSRT